MEDMKVLIYFEGENIIKKRNWSSNASPNGGTNISEG